MPAGADMLRLARTRLGEKYVNVLVPKNNANWHGPWDCAEFMSWLVYQVGCFLYGCIDDRANPAVADAYTGAWERDSLQLGTRVPILQAIGTPGAILLRYPPSPGMMGHIVVSNGDGGTVEARGRAYGVCEAEVDGRHWDTGIYLPGFSYGAVNRDVHYEPPSVLVGPQSTKSKAVRAIQRTLMDLGIDPGPIDGVYGNNTAAAVAAFQALEGVVVDGQVGKFTAKRLKIKLR